jgi:hypothetical protein
MMSDKFKEWCVFISKAIEYEKQILEETNEMVGVVMYHKGKIDAYRDILSMMQKTYKESEG